MDRGISIILPTRGRISSLQSSVDSLLCSAFSLSVKVSLAVDSDDLETLVGLSQNPIPNSTIYIFDRLGYRGLHHYVNQLCACAPGEWLFLWNDDALMETSGWDEIIASYTGQFVLLNPDSNHHNHASGNCIFPIIPRKWFETVGHFSLSNHNDTWVELVAKQLGIVRNVPIHILHDRVDLTGGNDDQTAREREFTTSEFFGPECQAGIASDVERLRSLIVPSQDGNSN